MATLPDTIEVQGEFELFAVSLPVFEGPFDLLLSLIARKKLDITEVALAQVTDEFIAFMKASPDLSRTTETSRRAMPTWRPAICCFPGSCSTAPSKKPRRTSANA